MPNFCKGYLSNTLEDSNCRTNGETECNAVSGKRLRSYVFGFAFRYLRPAPGEGLPLSGYPLKILTFPPNQKPRISHPDLFFGIYESYSMTVVSSYQMHIRKNPEATNRHFSGL